MRRNAFGSASQSCTFNWFKIFGAYARQRGGDAVPDSEPRAVAKPFMTDEHASPAKAYCAFKCRETIGYARDLLGGSGILLDNHVGGFIADVEAIYS
jgi:alkylation response protein AidB-like acyl-CoA dehydrogenase